MKNFQIFVLFRMEVEKWTENIKSMTKLDRELFTKEVDVAAVYYESEKEIKDIIKSIKRYFQPL